MASRYPQRYQDAPALRQRLAAAANSLESVTAGITTGESDAWTAAADIVALQRDILLRNPLLDFQRMVVLRRRFGTNARNAMGRTLGVGTLNAHTNDSLPRTGWDNEIAVLTDLRNEPVVKVLHNTDGRLITDLELDFDATRMMFSAQGLRESNWRVFELDLPGDGSLDCKVRQLTPDDGDDIGHFDSCYLGDPDEVIFCSTASYQGLPCEYGSRRMTCLFKLNRRTGTGSPIDL